eukprot:176031-Chlamydomonas_euryale.AAC.3
MRAGVRSSVVWRCLKGSALPCRAALTHAMPRHGPAWQLLVLVPQQLAQLEGRRCTWKRARGSVYSSRAGSVCPGELGRPASCMRHRPGWMHFVPAGSS